MSPTAKKVRVGDRIINEASLLGGLANVERKIEAWAAQNGLWHDSGFKTPFLYHGAAPRLDGGTVLLVSEGPIGKVLSGDDSYIEYQKPFASLLEGLGYGYDRGTHCTFPLYPTDERLQTDILSLHRWQWLQRLAEKKLFELHSEVFEHFATHPEDLKRIEWRQFEEILDAIFKNQGFYTELGTGRNDGGVDLRLYQNRAIPEVVTLVQAKRYKNPIKLEAVAALLGIALEQRAANAVFATTSHFQPKAHKFSLSVEKRVDLPNIELADSLKIGGWCAEIGQNLNSYFSNGLAGPPMISEQTGPGAGSIVVAYGGYNCRSNYFAKVEADFLHEAILRPIGSEIVSGDFSYGSEIPSESARVTWTKKARLLALKGDHGGYWVDSGEFYWDCQSFEEWDGTPQHFHSD